MNRREAILALVSLPAVQSVAVARLRSDDVIVIECPGELRFVDIERLRDQLLQAFPGQRAIVIPMGMKMRIVKADEV